MRSTILIRVLHVEIFYDASPSLRFCAKKLERRRSLREFYCHWQNYAKLNGGNLWFSGHAETIKVSRLGSSKDGEMKEDVLAINSSTLLSTLQWKTFRCDLSSFMIFEFYARKTFDGLSRSPMTPRQKLPGEDAKWEPQEHINVNSKTSLEKPLSGDWEIRFSRYF